MKNLIRFPEKGQQDPQNVIRQLKQAEVYQLVEFKQQLLVMKQELARMKRQALKLIVSHEPSNPGTEK